jgi:TatA/E family protein of Tat protein translocase
MPELILILVLALLLFGPKKLPEIGKQLGKGLGEFKRASNDLKRSIEEEIEKASVEPVAQHSAPVEAAKAPVERSAEDQKIISAATEGSPAPLKDGAPIRPS